jgi:hypothetical protein
MTNAKPQHPNAALTPRGRPKMVGLVIDHGWTLEATADKFQVDAKTPQTATVGCCSHRLRSRPSRLDRSTHPDRRRTPSARLR